MRGHLVKRAKDSWSVVLSLGRDERGKLRQKWVTVKGTRKDAERELATSLLHQDHDLVCARPDGALWKPDEFTRQFTKAVRGAGLPTVTFHRLRHSHASQLLRQGTSVTAVSARLGHASPAITMSVYAHCLAGHFKGHLRKEGLIDG